MPDKPREMKARAVEYDRKQEHHFHLGFLPRLAASETAEGFELATNSDFH